MKTKKSKLDLSSIRTVSLLYFIIFAVFLLLLVWFLQSFLINNYYEEMRISEIRNSARMLENKYRLSDEAFETAALDISKNSGVYIRVSSTDGVNSYNFASGMPPSSIGYDYEIAAADSKLKSSDLNSVSMTTKEDDSDLYTLVSASYLNPESKDEVLYLVAPLYPVRSTVQILRSQFKLITIFALVVAVILALYLSRRLSGPIDNITKSAVELSKGNFNVKFNGGMFTETNELARTLNTASYEMQRSESYQKDLIANVTHDLKTPLTMIKSYAEMIDDLSGDDPKKRKEHLGVIISEADRLNKLVSDMLAMSRLQSGSIIMDKSKFNIVSAAEEVFSTYKYLSDQEGYKIKFTKPKATYVYGDVDKIKQVMINFISNAIKYSEDDKNIEISLKRAFSGKTIRFSVLDHGIGIPSDEIGHVWDRYYRTSANHKQSVEGSGLGLSIVKGILSLHNANYGVNSKEGEGSEFWFEMDVVKK